MIKLFFKDERGPVELEWDDELQTLFGDGLFVYADSWKVWTDKGGMRDRYITDICSRIEFDNGVFRWGK